MCDATDRPLDEFEFDRAGRDIDLRRATVARPGRKLNEEPVRPWLDSASRRLAGLHWKLPSSIDSLFLLLI
jgi:hypothetical protein